MDLVSHFVAIQESMKKIRLFEKEERSKDITYHIKKLPSELVKYIFSYISLVPFDKQQFKDFFKYKAPFYKYFRDGDYYTGRRGFFLVAYDIRQPRGTTNPYQGQTRILDTMYEWNFHTIKKTKVLRSNNVSKNRFMYALIQYYRNKMELKEKIKEQMNKEDIAKAIDKNKPSSPFVCRMKHNELDKLYKTMFLAKD